MEASIPDSPYGVRTRGVKSAGCHYIEKQESREHTRAGKSLHVGKISLNGVLLENLLRRR
jgi:hypothetical protein